MDREQVIEELERIKNWATFSQTHGCFRLMRDDLDKITKYATDALTLLKEQEEVEPKEIITEHFPIGNYRFVITTTKDTLALLKEQEPVRHGQWEPSPIPCEKYVCSCCGSACWYYDYEGVVAKSNYCPNCGAKMDGRTENGFQVDTKTTM